MRTSIIAEGSTTTRRELHGNSAGFAQAIYPPRAGVLDELFTPYSGVKPSSVVFAVGMVSYPIRSGPS
jgi:hypothetical protein